MTRFRWPSPTMAHAVRAGVACALLAWLQAACGPAGEALAPTTVSAAAESAEPTVGPGQARSPSVELPAFQIPCGGAGIEVEEFTASDSILVASLAFEVPGSSAGVSLDWIGPYLDLNPRPAGSTLPFLEIVVMEWTTTQDAGVTRHLMKIGWPPFREANLRIRSAGAGCESSIACSKEGCEVTS